MPQIVELNSTTIAGVVIGSGELRGWSQESLAERAKVNCRSVQRVEVVQPVCSEATRKLAGAFDAKDLDCCLKSHGVPTDEEIATERERLARDSVDYAVTTRAFGRARAAFTDERFATLAVYLRDYGDCSDCSTKVQRLDVIRDLDRNLAQAVFNGLQCSVPDENEPPPLTRRTPVGD